ncbi:FbpB family small basic protein [Lentibacillus sp. JNUCC-1]|uniref:FbpB family small basic protein n=1 Tax=Lentibacillus sp. JNUCC-1 TaxID=2654513 RepID=UPI0012E8E350|nr:FbpB family small basic protein [Lentibacillus sp. JNUCC-1]
MAILLLNVNSNSPSNLNRHIKGVVEVALKKRQSFDELVQENRRQIMSDQELMNRIEKKLEQRRHEYLQKADT